MNRPRWGYNRNLSADISDNNKYFISMDATSPTKNETSVHSGLAAERGAGLTVCRERLQEDDDEESKRKSRRYDHSQPRWRSGRAGVYGGEHAGFLSCEIEMRCESAANYFHAFVEK